MNEHSTQTSDSRNVHRERGQRIAGEGHGNLALYYMYYYTKSIAEYVIIIETVIILKQRLSFFNFDGMVWFGIKFNADIIV